MLDKRNLITKLSIITTLTLTIGCASNDGLEQQVTTLSNKVDQLTMDVSKLKVQQTKHTEELAKLKQAQTKTNQRIDNVAASYKK